MKETVKCDGCGQDSKSEKKPPHWYSRSDSDGTQYACSRACIDKIAKETGKTRVIMPW